MKHPRLMAALLGLLLALPMLTLTAQDTGWPVETRCVGEPTAPPEGWTFEGTILLYGPYGIHGLKADWDTTHVLSFTNGYIGILSPDMHWTAITERYHECHGSCFASAVWVTGLSVFDITGENPRKVYSTPWHLYYGQHNGIFDEPRVKWLDNQNLVYDFDPAPYENYSEASPYIVNPFTGEMHPWDRQGDAYCWRCSPDRTRDLPYEYGDSPYYHLTDTSTGEVLLEFDLAVDNPFPELKHPWSPNSGYFINVTDAGESLRDLELYDRDGRFIGTFLRQNMDGPSGTGFSPFSETWQVFWSPDSQSFHINDTQPEAQPGAGYRLPSYLVDILGKRTINPCLAPYNGSRFMSYAWSPDNQQIAFVGEINKKSRIVVFDIRDWKLYTLSYFDEDGSVLGWRED